MNLDRFSHGLADAQEETEVFCCEHCGGEVYEGDRYYEVEGSKVCSEECVIGLLGIESNIATK
jgi:hypothetical protein